MQSVSTAAFHCHFTNATHIRGWGQKAFGMVSGTLKPDVCGIVQSDMVSWFAFGCHLQKRVGQLGWPSCLTVVQTCGEDKVVAGLGLYVPSTFLCQLFWVF
jgi:hypothetical protein